MELAQLEQRLTALGVNIADARDVIALKGYNIGLLVDDSSSMLEPVSQGGAKACKTRWDEVLDTVEVLCDIGDCLGSQKGIYFTLPSSSAYSSSGLIHRSPCGKCFMTQALRKLQKERWTSDPSILLVLTASQPADGAEEFRCALSDFIRQRPVLVQIMPFSSGEGVSYLRNLNLQFKEVNVLDDFNTTAGKYQAYFDQTKVTGLEGATNCRFTRADWCVQAMLGAISTQFDRWAPSAIKPDALEAWTGGDPHNDDDDDNTHDESSTQICVAGVDEFDMDRLHCGYHHACQHTCRCS